MTAEPNQGHREGILAAIRLGPRLRVEQPHPPDLASQLRVSLATEAPGRRAVA